MRLCVGVTPADLVESVSEENLHRLGMSIRHTNRGTFIALDAADYEAAKKQVAALLLRGGQVPGDWGVLPCEDLDEEPPSFG